MDFGELALPPSAVALIAFCTGLFWRPPPQPVHLYCAEGEATVLPAAPGIFAGAFSLIGAIALGALLGIAVLSLRRRPRALFDQ